MWSEKRKIGNIGEDIVCKFLMKQGFRIKERNYLRKWGEIDVVAEKEGKLHFVEVKSVSCEKKMGDYRPEENVHSAKIKRLSRAIQTYLAEKDISEEQEWCFDIAVVYLNLKDKSGEVEMLEDIIL